jgi:hypothetical protein
VTGHCGVCASPVEYTRTRNRHNFRMLDPVPFYREHRCSIVTGTLRECACGSVVLEWESDRPRANPDGTLHVHQDTPSRPVARRRPAEVAEAEPKAQPKKAPARRKSGEVQSLND